MARTAGLAVALLLGACSAPPQPALAVGVNMRVDADPLVLAREQGLVEPGRMKVVELASGSEVQRALNNGLLDAAALTLAETLRLVDAGVELRIVALLNTSRGTDRVVARSDILSPRERRGEPVAVEDSSVNVLVVRASVLRARPGSVDTLLRAWAAGLDAVNADATRAAVALSPGTGLNAIDYVGALRGAAFVPLDESLQQLSGPSVALEARARAVGGALMDAGMLRRMPLLVELVDTSALKRVLGAPGHS